MGDQVAPKVLKAAVARICEGEGVDITTQSCLNTLMHLAMSHITTISQHANESAEASGRTVTNITDLSIALAENQQSLSSLNEFVHSTRKKDVKPIQNTPKFPLYPTVIMDQPGDLISTNRTPYPAYIPPFLPQFPPEHTYRTSTIASYRSVDTSVGDKKRELQHEAMKDVLVNLSGN